MQKHLIPTKGIEKAELFRALWNVSKPQSLGIVNPTVTSGHDMTIRECKEIVKESRYLFFDYGSRGVVTIDLDNPEGFDSTAYDLIVGANAAENALEALRVAHA